MCTYTHTKESGVLLHGLQHHDWCYAAFTALSSKGEVTLAVLMLAAAGGEPAYLLQSFTWSCNARRQAFPSRYTRSDHHVMKTLTYSTSDRCESCQWFSSPARSKEKVHIDIVDTIRSVWVFLLCQRKQWDLGVGSTDLDPQEPNHLASRKQPQTY